MVVMGKMTFKHEMLSEPTFAFVDIETTGGNAQRDRITEIGIRFWRNGAVVGEWQTLLNPGSPDLRVHRTTDGYLQCHGGECPSF